MQKARFYDRMVFAGTFCRCFLQEHETEVSQRRFTLQRGSSFFVVHYSFARRSFATFLYLRPMTTHATPTTSE